MQTSPILCKWKFLLITGPLLLAMTLLQAQSFKNTNHAYWYQPNTPVRASMQLWQKDPDTIQVFAQVQLNGEKGLESYQFFMHQRHSLDSAANDPLPLTMSLMSSQENRHLMQVNVPINTGEASAPLHYFLLEVQDTVDQLRSYWTLSSISPENSFAPAPFYILQQLKQNSDSLPLLLQYATTGAELELMGRFPSYVAFYYEKAFEIASPPMSATANTAGLEVTEIFELRPDSLWQPSGEGLYFIQHDTTQLSGKSFRLTNRYFPEVGTIEDFAGPIRYISTNDEWLQLEKNNFTKKELDKFWLKVAQTEERAKSIIRHYYDRVKWANHLFTNYKEGWKTDQGMIFILYGPPQIVKATAEREEWIYTETSDIPEIKFTFVRVKNPFTDRHFVLLRNKNYTSSHYQIVSKWRKGRNTL